MVVSIFTFPFLLLSVMLLMQGPGFGLASQIVALALVLVPIVGAVFAGWSFCSKSKARVLIADGRTANILGREAVLKVFRKIQSMQSEFATKEKHPSLLSLLLFPNFTTFPEIQDRIAAIESQ